MRSTLLTAGIYILLFSVLIVVSCTNSSEIPFPADKEEFSQPVAAALKFSAPEKLKFADSLTNIKLPSRPFDYDKLPTGLFDSSGFMPFPKPPIEVSFDWDKLPAAPFDYDKLPSKPLLFETQILPPPKTIKIGRPVRKKGASELLYEIGDPLNGKIISALFEDKNGFLWIAAENELYRYNGEELAYYMNFSFLISLLEDNTGRIWIASNTGSGIAVINTKTSTISFVRNEKKAFSRMFADRQNRIWLSTPTAPGPVTIIDLSTNTIKEIRPAQGLVTGNANSAGMFQDDFGNVWIATRNGGLNIIDFKNKKIKYLTKENGLSSDSLASALLITDDKKRVWAASYTGEIHSIDIQHGIIKRYGHDQGLKKDLVPSMLYGRDGNIWIGKQSSNDPKGGIEIIDPVNDKLKKIGPSNGLLSSNISRLAQSRNGSIWVGTSLGLNLLSLKNDYNIRRIGYKDVSTQMEDVQGKIWTGYLYDGIQIRDTNARTVKYLTTAQGLSDNTIQQVLEDNGKIFVLNNIGVDIIDFARKKIEWLGNKQGIRNTPQIAVKTPDGKIWITMITPGIEVFDPAAKTIYHIDSISGIASAVVSNVLLDKAAAMWMGGTNSGIVTLDTKTLTTRALNVISLNESTGNKVFLADSRGNLWIGTGDRGVFMINADRDSITHFSVNEGVLSENVISLLEYNGKIFIGTNKGITILTFPSATTAKWTTESLGKSDGIEKEASTVYSDLITRKGEYWWGDKGIKIIGIADRPVQDSIAPPVFINGISLLNRQQYYITTSATGTNKRDTIWTPGKDHFYTDDSLPGNNFFNAQKKIKMDSVTGIYNLPVNLQIPHTDNYIQFHFLQMDPDRRNKDTIWYRYVLEGLDTKWSDRTANTNSENYVNLQSGQYTFKVSAAFKGKWSEPVIFSFTVLPPWWRTWWAYAAYLLCFSYSVWTFIKYRSRWLQKENRVLEEKVAHRTIQLNKSIEDLKSTQAQLIQSEKMASLGELTAGIAHEIQNPLNFVNNFSEVNNELIEELKSQKSNLKSEEQDQILNDIFQNNEKINHHGKRADSIVKGMLQHSRSGSVQKELTDINALADEYLRLSYHGLRAKDSSFNVSIETDFDKSIERVNVVQQDFGRVILNLINNAFYAVSEKKPNNGTPYVPMVSVKTKKIESSIELTVKDNGNGVPQSIIDKIFNPFFTTKPTGLGTGLGLSLSYDIIKAHGGEIKVHSEEGIGTEFIISLPLI